MAMTRILYASDFHGSNACFRKFLGAALQYQATVLMVGGDVTGKAMIPIVHQGQGRYQAHLFGRSEEPTTAADLERLRLTISNVGFYPVVLEPEEAKALEDDPARMGSLFERLMCERVSEWLALAEEKLSPAGARLFFMPGNDDLYSIDRVIGEFSEVRNPDGRRLWLDDDHEVVGMAHANMTPWRCSRDIEEDELTRKLDALEQQLERPDRAVALLHVPPYDSAIDSCPDLDENLQIIHRGGHVLMKSAGSHAVRAFLERVQPMLSLHGHIHEAPGHVRVGRTLAINAGSEYAEGIMKAAIINLERDRVKGHMLISA